MKIRSITCFTIIIWIGCWMSSCEPFDERKHILWLNAEGDFHPVEGKVAQEKSDEVVNTWEIVADPDQIHEEHLFHTHLLILDQVNLDSLSPRVINTFERYLQAGGTVMSLNTAYPNSYHWPWLVRESAKSNVKTDTLSRGILMQDFSMGRGRWLNVKGHLISQKVSNQGDLHLAWNNLLQTVLEHTTLPDYRHADLPTCPDDRQFLISRLSSGFDEPIELAVTPDTSVFIIERKGGIKYYDPVSGATEYITCLNTISTQSNGLNGMVLDPDFTHNQFIYFSYAPSSDTLHQYISRFTFQENNRSLVDEVVIMKIPMDYTTGWHGTNSIAFGPGGFLYIGMGDFTLQSADIAGYAQIDERPGHHKIDAQRTAANTMSPMGKVLRIKPLEDGSYEIPRGNLFAGQPEKGLPEIFAMGFRNPYRFSVDPQTGWLYVGDVGPDAVIAGPKGPGGFDEVNQVKTAGFYGWPYFVANNKPYRDVDYQLEEIGPPFDPQGVVNLSPNNTGMRQLPDAQPPIIWYPKGRYSDVFPHMGTGGVNVMVGSFYDQQSYPVSTHRFPAYYDGKLLIYDWVRSWINLVTLDEEQSVYKIEPFLRDHTFSKPIDMEFGPEGALYVLEYGNRGFAANPDAALTRIVFQEAVSFPDFKIEIDKVAGAAPMEVQLKAIAEQGVECEECQFRWEVETQAYDGKAVQITLETPGRYQPILTVIQHGQSFRYAGDDIIVGNEAPAVRIISQANQSFFWKDSSWPYRIIVEDPEDGSTLEGTIKPEDLDFRFTYTSYGATVSEENMQSQAITLIEQNPCGSCHQPQKAGVGPSFTAIAERYGSSDRFRPQLVSRIIHGGVGNWGGNIAMPAHPHLSEPEASMIVDYILSYSSINAQSHSFPLESSLSLDKHRPGEQGQYVFEVSYTDRGGKKAPPLVQKEIITLRSARISPAMCDGMEGVVQHVNSDLVTLNADTVWLKLEQIDLRGVGELVLTLSPGSREVIISLCTHSAFTDCRGSREVHAIDNHSSLGKEIAISLSALQEVTDLYILFIQKDKILQPQRSMDIHMLDFNLK